jgi:hypothetical protein
MRLPLVLLLLLVPAAASAATAEALLYERALMRAAGARCGLFEPPVQRALHASAIQARGAALRGGASLIALGATERRAATRANRTACASPELTVAATRVRGAFAGYARLNRIPLEGWTADRLSLGWRLRQTARFGFHRATLGLAGPGVRPAVAVSFADGATPAAARLRVRDPARDPHPDLRGASAAQRTPALATSRVIFAAEQTAAPAGLAPGKTGRLFRLPPTAAPALAALDPREAVTVEFVFPGDQVRTAIFEVGDFAAGLAFLEAGG